MSILSGYKKVKNYIETGSGKKLLSRWTSSNTVEFEDGKTAQTKVGAIKGITTSTNTKETGYAADATTVAALNQSLGNLHLIHLESRRIQGTGYSFSYISYKTGYRLINVIVNYNTSSQGNYRVNTIQYDDTNKVYVVYLNQALASSSYLVVDLIYMSE